MQRLRVQARADGWAYLSLMGIWGLSMAATLYWLYLDRAPLCWDQAERLVQSISIYRTLSHPSTGMLAQIAAAHDFYPPMVALVAAAGYAVAGVSADVGSVAVSGFFLAILILATYDLGKSLATPRVGVLAALVVATYPSIFGGRDSLDIDLALTAQVAAFVALLLRSRGFAERGWSIAAGVVAGTAMLTKWMFPVFVGVPALYMVWWAWRGGASWRRLAANVGLALACCALIAATWWGYKWHHILFEFVPWAAGTGPSEGDPQLLTEPFWAATYYLVGLNLQLSFLYLALLVVALPVFCFSRQSAAWQKVILGLWMALPYVALTAISNKEPRYLEPAYPAMALITAMLLDGLLRGARWRPVRIGAVTVVLAFAICQLYSISFGSGWIRANAHVPRVPNEGRFTDREFELYLYSQSYGCAPHPDPDDWQAATILDTIERHEMAETGLKILVFSEQPELKYPLILHSFENQLDYTVQSVGQNAFEEQDYDTADFVLIHTPPQTLRYRTDSPEIARRIDDGTGRFQDLDVERHEFDRVADLDLRNGSQVTVYARTVAYPEK